jgi:hypothetical protein
MLDVVSVALTPVLLNSLTAIDGHDRQHFNKSLQVGNFTNFCPLLAFDSWKNS